MTADKCADDPHVWQLVDEMSDKSAMTGLHGTPSFRELYTPKLVTVLREGYDASKFRADLVAGLTVAIVALPLSMAITIASGVSPDKGLFSAIVGGFLVSMLGGSRFQVGGPAGAFIVLVAATVADHGINGLILATMMSGVFLTVVGYLRLGTHQHPGDSRIYGRDRRHHLRQPAS